MPEKRGKAEDKKEPPPKKPPGYRNFEKVLKQVVKAPPMRKPSSLNRHQTG